MSHAEDAATVGFPSSITVKSPAKVRFACTGSSLHLRTPFRGQIWVFDFMSGLVALSFIMLVCVLIWNSSILRWGLIEKYGAMESSAYFASESLLTTSGVPPSWEMLPYVDENISAIGLVNSRNDLNRLKLEKLIAEEDTAYPVVRMRLGLQRYEFGFRVTDLHKENTYYEFGNFSFGSQNTSLSFDRFGVLDGEPVIVHMEVWGG